MMKSLIIAINSKNYDFAYSKEGNRYNLQCDASEMKAHIPSFFVIANGGANYMVVSDRTHEYMRQIIPQINKNELRG